MKVILSDWSQLTHAVTHAFSSDFRKGKDTANMEHIFRHVLLTTLLSYKKQFGMESRIVIAVDSRKGYRRKDVFPLYKQHRKKAREESDIDWGTVFAISDKMKVEFAEIFPFNFIEVEKAEADDVIAIMCKYWDTNETVETAFTSDKTQVVIVSNDGDFGQLHKYKHVRQWDPIRKKFIEKTDKYFLLEKCIRGDAGDGVPSIRCADDFFIDENSGRAPSITKVFLQEQFDKFDKGEQIYFGDKNLDERYRRNRVLIDFANIPENIEKAIIDKYSSYNNVSTKQKIFNYFIAKRCRNLMERIGDF